MNRQLLTLLLGVGIGVGIGYFLWNPVAEPFTPALVENEEQPVAAADDHTGAGSDTEVVPQSRFALLEAEAIRRLSRRDYAGALELLLEADLEVSSQIEAAQVTSLLEETVRLRVDQLRAMDRLAEIDALYERLTLSMPERAEYYLLLAKHRIDTDNEVGALPVLAQIQNHHQLGGRARDLIEQIGAPEEAPPLAMIPLERSGDQFLVVASLDASRTVKLLIDTGASLTVIEPQILSRLGYDLRRDAGRFVTAGGPVVAPIVDIEGLALADQAVSGLRVGALGIDGRSDVDGLLGMDYLSRFRFRLDQDQNALVLESRR